MKIRFKALTKTEVILRNYKAQIWEFDPGEELEVTSITFSEPKKVKTRPGHPGGRMRYAEIEPVSEARCISDVPEIAFEIVD